MFFIFCNQLEFHKAQSVPRFTILSLRYSADFGRSRLVLIGAFKKFFQINLIPHLVGKTKDANGLISL